MLVKGNVEKPQKKEGGYLLSHHQRDLLVLFQGISLQSASSI